MRRTTAETVELMCRAAGSRTLLTVLLLAQGLAHAEQQGGEEPPSRHQDARQPPATAQPAPRDPPQRGPDSFEPSEKISPDSAISFPVDI